ncbi:hypothetical protein C2E23DRAFT_888488 [Lenzites betulinus]|nr:hypothetical protein C2E23DRAFT_888488 [Lenzites betulinus]
MPWRPRVRSERKLDVHKDSLAPWRPRNHSSRNFQAEQFSKSTMALKFMQLWECATLIARPGTPAHPVPAQLPVRANLKFDDFTRFHSISRDVHKDSLAPWRPRVRPSRNLNSKSPMMLNSFGFRGFANAIAHPVMPVRPFPAQILLKTVNFTRFHWLSLDFQGCTDTFARPMATVHSLLAQIAIRVVLKFDNHARVHSIPGNEIARRAAPVRPISAQLEFKTDPFARDLIGAEREYARPAPPVHAIFAQTGKYQGNQATAALLNFSPGTGRASPVFHRSPVSAMRNLARRIVYIVHDGEKGPALGSERDSMRSEARTLFNEAIFEASGGRQRFMRWCADGYARYIVIKCGLKLVGWPEDVPFRDLSQGGVGVELLRELLRRWRLKEGDAARLRFEPATAEDRAIAERDPASAIPNGATLGITGQSKPTGSRAPPLVVKALVQHPLTLDVVGIARTSTKRRERAGSATDERKPRQQEQRNDFGRRRLPLMHPELNRPPRRGLTSLRSVIAGREGVEADAEGRPAKHAREDCAVDDRLEEFSEYETEEDAISAYSECEQHGEEEIDEIESDWPEEAED